MDAVGDGAEERCIRCRPAGETRLHLCGVPPDDSRIDILRAVGLNVVDETVRHVIRQCRHRACGDRHDCYQLVRVHFGIPPGYKRSKEKHLPKTRL